MKTIQIPTNSNPFVVVINNTTYTYKAGDTVEVPDEVADVIENALDLEPKPKRYLDKFAQRIEGSISEVDKSDLDGLRTIAANAFSDCDSITEITIPDSIQNIKSGAFYSCSNLESVDIGDGVQRIASNVFDRCIELARVYLPKTPPALENVNAFDNIKADCTFYCKTQASLNAYKVATNWSTLTGTYSFVVEK
jgi:hypothetical protein